MAGLKGTEAGKDQKYSEDFPDKISQLTIRPIIHEECSILLEFQFYILPSLLQCLRTRQGGRYIGKKNSQHCSDEVSTLIVKRVKRNKHNNEIVELILKVILDTDGGHMYKAGKSAWEFALVKRADMQSA